MLTIIGWEASQDKLDLSSKPSTNLTLRELTLRWDNFNLRLVSTEPFTFYSTYSFPTENIWIDSFAVTNAWNKCIKYFHWCKIFFLNDQKRIPGTSVHFRQTSITTASAAFALSVSRSTSPWNALINGKAALRKPYNTDWSIWIRSTDVRRRYAKSYNIGCITLPPLLCFRFNSGVDMDAMSPTWKALEIP